MERTTRILVVDDEQGIRDLLDYELSGKGYAVKTAKNGKEALDILASVKVDLVISDIRMPKMDGMEMLDAIKRIDPEIEVILSTGYGTVETAVAAMKKGAYDFVQKPFQFEEILALIEKALEKSELKALLGVYKASRAMFKSIKLDSLLPVIVGIAKNILNADDVSIMLLKGNSLEVAASCGLDLDRRARTELALGERVAGKVAQFKDSVIITGPLEEDERFKEIPSLRSIKSSIVCPLIIEQETLGVLNANRVESDVPFSAADKRNLMIFASQVAQAVFNAKTYRQLEDKVAELRKAYRSLEDTQAQLIHSDKLAAVGRLAAGVAHELNNPLTSVLAFSQILLEEGRLSAEQKEALECINEQGQRCRRIVLDLLQFSRKNEPNKEEVTVSSILEATLKFARYDLVAAGTEFVQECPDPSPTVLADGFQIQQVFLNLITNAVHAMKSAPTKRLLIRVERSRRQNLGGGTYSGDASVAGDDKFVRIQFQDTGSGIAQVDLGNIFEPFFTTKSPGAGTGLGLSICHGIITAHGGRIEAASRQGKGTTFTINLPEGSHNGQTQRAITRG